MTPDQKQALIDKINRRSAEHVPHNRELGLKLVDFDYETGGASMILPYDEKLIGDPSTGVIHGAAITTLMDSACGMAVGIKLASREPIATVDLRIDYLKPARPWQDVIARVECYKVTRAIAFVRGLAHHPDAPNDPIASVAATFIRKKAQ